MPVVVLVFVFFCVAGVGGCGGGVACHAAPVALRIVELFFNFYMHSDRSLILKSNFMYVYNVKNDKVFKLLKVHLNLKASSLPGSR